MGLFFPYRTVFRELGLWRRWWHRLLVVSFGVSLAISVWVIWQEGNSLELKNYEQCYAYKLQSEASSGPMTNIDCKILSPIHPLFNLGFALGAGLIISYSLQIAYRVALYVIYGRVSRRQEEVRRLVA